MRTPVSRWRSSRTSFVLVGPLGVPLLLALAVSSAIASIVALSSCGGTAPVASPSAAAIAVAPFARPPSLTAPLSDEARPLAYRLHLTIDPSSAAFSGEVEIDVALARPAAQLWLHADGLTIDRVEVVAGGRRFSPRAVDPAAPLLGIDLGRTLSPSTTAAAPALTVRVAYRGSTERDEEGLFREEIAGKRYLYSQAQAEAARRITPCFDEPRHKVPWQVTVIAPKDAVVLGNAPALRDEPLADGRHRTTFAATPPMPSYLLALAAGPFQLIEVGRLGRQRFPTRIAIPSGLSADHLRAAASIAAAALPRAVSALERWLAAPLPLAKLDLVAVPDFFGAMENLGLITMNAGDLLGLDAQDRTPFVRVLVHELAHQWFGNLVTPASWDDLWLSEGLATWASQQVFPELALDLALDPALDPALDLALDPALDLALDPALDPSDAERAARGSAPPRLAPASAAELLSTLPSGARDRLERDAAFARVSSQMEARVAEQVTPAALRRRAGDQAERMFDLISYDKGAATITMLAHWIGEERFLEALRDYLAAHRDRSVPGEALAAALERAHPEAGRVLVAALTRKGVPDVGLSLSCAAGAPPVLRVVTAATAGPLPVCVRWDAGPGQPPRSACGIFEGPGELSLPTAAGHCPGWVSGNDDLRGYYRVAWTASPGALLDRRGPLPPVAQQTRAERLGRLWELAAELWRGPFPPSAFAELGGAPAASIEQEVGELELFAALEPWVLDDELAAWRAFVERRAHQLLRPSLVTDRGELADRRLALLHQLLPDLRWPRAITTPARSELRLGLKEPRNARRSLLDVSRLDKAWRLALRSGATAPLAEYLAAVAVAAEHAASRDALTPPPPELAVLPQLPRDALPALLGALDRGELRWSTAIPALAAYLTRRPSQDAALRALLERREALARHLAPVELSPLLAAAAFLCSRAQLQAADELLRDLLQSRPGGERKRAALLRQIERCAEGRARGGGLRGRAIALPPG